MKKIEERIIEFGKRDVPNIKSKIKNHPSYIAHFAIRSKRKRFQWFRPSFKPTFAVIIFLIVGLFLTTNFSAEQEAQAFTLTGAGEIEVVVDEENNIISAIGKDDLGRKFLENKEYHTAEDIINDFVEGNAGRGGNGHIEVNSISENIKQEKFEEIFEMVENKTRRENMPLPAKGERGNNERGNNSNRNSRRP